MTRILVCGSRDWTDKEFILETLEMVYRDHEPMVLIHGANGYDERGRPSWYTHKPTVRGVDMMAHEWAVSRPCPVEAHAADWKRYGKAAGPKRNQQMLDSGPDLVIAIHNDITASKGTQDMAERALAAGVPVTVVSHWTPYTRRRNENLCTESARGPEVRAED